MQIEIQARDFSLTDALRLYAQRRLHYAFSSRDDRIQRVVMRLTDINGPRGGADKCCQLQVILAGLPDLLVQDVETDLYVAIDRAVDRAGRALVRRLNRQRERARSPRVHMML